MIAHTTGESCRRRRCASGYSLIEVLVALVILMILVQVLATSLVTVLSVEQKAAEARKLSDLSQLLTTDTLLGIDEDLTLSEWPYPDWKPSHELVSIGRGDAASQWHAWSLTAQFERVPRLQIYLAKREE